MVPSIVIVPGSFCLPSAYNELIQPLSSKGYDIHAVALKSAIPKGPDSPSDLPSMYDDAAAIAAAVSELAEEGKDVIVVAHSYGGAPASESIQGLSKQARKKEGKKGGVVRLAYMSALVPEIGQGAMDVSIGGADPENALVPVADENGWFSVPDIEGLIRVTFSDVTPRELAEEWADRIERHSSLSFQSPLTQAGYEDVPVSWLFLEDDKMVNPKTQQTGINTIEKASGRKVDVTSLEAGHIPYIMKLDEVLEWFEKLLHSTC